MFNPCKSLTERWRGEKDTPSYKEIQENLPVQKGDIIKVPKGTLKYSFPTGEVRTKRDVVVRVYRVSVGQYELVSSRREVYFKWTKEPQVIWTGKNDWCYAPMSEVKKMR